MKKGATIRSLLGFTQEELALILNISRSHLSLYELGKRDLPLQAMQLLGELLTHLKSPEMAAKSPPHVELQQAKNQQHLERLLYENEFQQLHIVRTIAGLEKKVTAKARALQAIDFLHFHPSNKGDSSKMVLKTIATKANKVLEADEATLLVEYRIKQELLALEKLLLHAELRKLGITF